MTHEAVFDSSRSANGEVIALASGYVSLTKINFINENILVTVEAKSGQVDFFNAEEKPIASVKVETPAQGDEKFSDLRCSVEGDIIKLGFPKYGYEDNYPNCDGEYDRWTKVILGFEDICFNRKTARIIK